MYYDILNTQIVRRRSR